MEKQKRGCVINKWHTLLCIIYGTVVGYCKSMYLVTLSINFTFFTFFPFQSSISS